MTHFAQAFLTAMNADPRIANYATYVLYQTLGPSLPQGLASAAPLWLMCQNHAGKHTDDVRRVGHEGHGPALGNALFAAIPASQPGVVVSHADIPTDTQQWRKPSGTLEPAMTEMLQEWTTLHDFKLPTRSAEFPLLLVAGERRLYTANTAIRDPAWMKSNNPASLAIHPADASVCRVQDAATARLVTRRGAAEVQLHFDDCMKRGTISLPNGLGLSYPDASGNVVTFGVAPNELTDIEDRDPWVGTPWHKHVRARLEPFA